MKLIPMKSFVFLTILFTSLIHSQQTINGIVIDENNNPLVGESVLIRGTNQGAQTNFDGHFTLEVRESFPKTLQISYVGYNTETIQVDSSDMIARGRFDEVIVSASRRAEKLQEAPAAVSVVTAEQVSLSGGSLSPLRALTNSPGVELQQQTGQRINIGDTQFVF
jgi:iron complex outermembrane receptor protein